MSGTSPQSAPATSTVPIVAQAGSKDQIVRDARSLQDAVVLARASNPDFAKQLEGSAAIYSKTVWGVPLSMVVSVVVTRYGFGWDDQTQALFVFFVGTGASWLCRWLTTGPISGWFKVPATPTDTKAAP
jgi:hypothetical protein